MRKGSLAGKVVVITGASSGIGREAALQFARRRACVVLAARDEAALREVAEECRTHARAGDVLVLPTDVARSSQVDALADAALQRFGRIDVWVNDAGVYMMGRFEDTPEDAFRDLFETNVMGYVHGARAALRAFRARGHGVLIHVGSMAGKVPYALSSAYCMSKRAIHALNESLVQELRGSGIHTCVVAPATVDTPLFQHAANFTGREIVAMPPIYSPERVARAIVSCAERPRREVRVGSIPRAADARMPAMVERDHLGEGWQAPTSGNLREPLQPHAVRGGWKRRRRARLGRVVAIAGLAAIPLVAARLLATR